VIAMAMVMDCDHNSDGQPWTVMESDGRHDGNLTVMEGAMAYWWQ